MTCRNDRRASVLDKRGTAGKDPTVDDDPINLEVLVRELRLLGVGAETAQYGSETPGGVKNRGTVE